MRGNYPCPFCGSTDLTTDEISPKVWAVCCNVCKAIGPESLADLADAEERWTSRHFCGEDLAALREAIGL